MLHEISFIFVAKNKKITLILKKENTNKLFIFIAGLLIFAHTVFPHHHHFDSLESLQDNPVSENSKSNHQNKNHSTHCHALNLIYADKAGVLVVKKSINSNFHHQLFNFELYHQTKPILNKFTTNNSFTTPLKKQIVFVCQQLRAPPITARYNFS